MGTEMSNARAVVDFNILPEDCIANVLWLTTPRDACRLSLVASSFRSAAQSDAVWERFLPSDYRDILARAIDSTSTLPLLGGLPYKKQLYLHLCDQPVVIDKGRKSFSLEKWSGKKCFMLGARDLTIVWADTPRYWRWTSLTESRFGEAAELINVCWLEIRGKISTRLLSPDTTYAAYLVYKSSRGAYGFEYQPAEGWVGLSDSGSGGRRVVYLDPHPHGVQRHRYPRHMSPPTESSTSGEYQYPKERADLWLEIELGVYVNKLAGGEDEGELEMRLMEVKSGDWKSGLIVQGIEIRPKEKD